ncbi:hypothetical protein TWF730_005904 [Orbilia blumenaviensis]|uniref:Uncharacterized protein n=1 Tax=Orbilia blumenaviensis TaxID=1796055 RepID=A0AAV9VK38_9PEZI
MLELSLVLVVYAVSYLKFFVDPTYVEQKLSTEFNSMKNMAEQGHAVPTTVTQEAALLYVDELRHQKDANLASGRPCFKPTRFNQPFYACVEKTGWEAELQGATVEFPGPLSVSQGFKGRSQGSGDSLEDEDKDGYEDEDDDPRRYEEQISFKTKGQYFNIPTQLPPSPPIVPPYAPRLQFKNTPPPPQPLPAEGNTQISAEGIDLQPLSLRIRPPSPEAYGYIANEDPMTHMMDDDCEEAMIGQLVDEAMSTD